MKSSDIFAPITQYQLDHGLKTTNKQISQTTGICENRIKTLKDDPGRATVAELEALAREYKFRIEVRG